MTDFVVVGGGIAGVTAAAHLAPHGSVTLVETERSLAYHTTGRSAALFVANYGSSASRPLALTSRAFFDDPPEGSTEGPLLTPRGLMWVANESQVETMRTTAMQGQAAGIENQWLDGAEAASMVPVLRSERITAALYEPEAYDIDVAAVHQAFVRLARRHDAVLRTDERVIGIERNGVGWRVETGKAQIACGAVVNASGAWGDHVGSLAGAKPIGLQPMRRTAFMVPGEPEYSSWPMVVGGDQRFYFKPDGEQLFCSLSEENPDEPSDARPRMEDVALAIDRINEATTLGIRSVNSQWTGLRTFAPDRELVVGEDPEMSGFFWLVGQGGTGIQTAPAYGGLLASQVLGTSLPTPLEEAGFNAASLSPSRFH